MAKQKPSLCDEKTFDSFFKDQARSLTSYLYYKFGSKNLAQDIAQEAFIKLWHKCAEVPVKKARGFLYTVAANLGTSAKRHDQVKLKYQEKAIKVSVATMDNESPEYLILEKEFMEKLTGAIAQLPEKQREAWLLNRVEKKTYREIAEMMGVSVKAVEKLMHKALQKLRIVMGDV